MKVLKTFYYELWHKMPFWLAAISILLLYPIISHTETPNMAFVNLFGITCVLLFTNIILTVSKRINPFKNISGTKGRYIAATGRIFIFIILSATFVTAIDLICQAYFYNQHLKIFVFFPFYSVSCLVLCQYGSFPTQHNIKDTFINSINSGIGFGIFLMIIGAVSITISRYLYIPHLPAIIGIAGLILIIGLSKARVNHRINAKTHREAF